MSNETPDTELQHMYIPNDPETPIVKHLFDQVNVYADIASNHKGSIKLYNKLIRAITDAGAIPKIQLYSPGTFDRMWELPPQFVASIFNTRDLDYILPHNPLALKIASAESTHYDLIRAAGDTNLPLIISTGGMNDDELVSLCEVIEPYSGNVCLMHCVSLYPTPMDKAEMARISLLSDIMEDMVIQPYVGWSTHCPDYGLLLPIALAYDALQIELHVKTDAKAYDTEDERSAIEVHELTHVMDVIREVLPVFGDCYDDFYEPPDRAAILQYRKRWQHES